MRKIFFMYVMLIGPSFTFAGTLSGSSASGETPAVELGIGTNFTRFNYKELCTPSDQEGATYNSTLGNVKFHVAGTLSYFEGQYETGSVNSKYAGAVLNTGAPINANDQLKFTDYSAKFNLALSDMVFIYAGYGHHKWLRVLNNAYAETYQWNVIPVGLLAWYMKSETVDLGVDLGLLPKLNSKIHADTSSYIAGGTDSDAALGNKTGFKVRLPIVWHSGAFLFETTPWFEHSEIGQSNAFVNKTLFTSAPYEGYEPSSYTNIFGLEIMAAVRF